MKRRLAVKLFEFAIDLGAEVEPVQSCRESVTRQSIELLPAAPEHNPMDHDALMRNRFFVSRRKRDYVNVVPGSGE